MVEKITVALEAYSTGNDRTACAEALKRELTSIETAAAAGAIPAEASKEIRRAVDNCRTALWAAAIASVNGQHTSEAVLLAARFVRV